MKIKNITNEIWKNFFNSKEPFPEDFSVSGEESDKIGKNFQKESSKKNKLSEQKWDDSDNNLDRPEQSQKAPALIVGSELNLERNSIFTFTASNRRSREIIFKEISPSGEINERQITIGKLVDGTETGVLTTNHFKVYLALIKFWEESGKPINDKVHFTILGILKEIGIMDTGPNYETIKRILRQLIQIPLTFRNSFFVSGDNLQQGYYETLEDFHILGNLYIYERKNIGRKQRVRGYGEFKFSDAILRNLINNHTHPLRLDVIREFKRHRDFAILLYTYLDRNLAFRDKYEIGLEKLFNHLDLSQEQVRYPSDRKAKLNHVLDEIVGKELSTGILFHAEIVKTADGQDYKLVCRKKPFPKKIKDYTEQPDLSIEAESYEPEIQKPPEPISELFPLLIGNGLTEKQSAKLISEKDPDVIRAQVDYLSHRIAEYKSQGKEINIPAILYDSISDNWKAPKVYVEAEKAKERAKKLEAKRMEEEKIALEEREAFHKEEQEREELKAYKESLSPDDRAKLREKAMERISNMKGLNEEFINDTFIEIQENAILREEI